MKDVLAIAVMGFILSRGGPAVAQQEPETKSRTRLDIRVSPAIDFHFHARTLAESRDAPAVPQELAGVVRTSKEMGMQLDARWGILEGNLNDCDTVAEIRETYVQLPETVKLRGVRPPQGTRQFRKPAVALADAMVKAEPHFLSEIWPRNKSAIDAAVHRVAREFAPKQSECIAYMLKHLGIQDPGVTIPVYLVDTAPFPGAFTQRTYGGGAVCFVATRNKNLQGTLLFETILHESTHAIDIASKGQSVFGILRDRLEAVGIDRRNKQYRDVPHTLMFIHAGETLRRIVDTDHVHYGDVAAYYPKAPIATRAIRPMWIQYLDGTIARDDAIDRIIEAVLAETKKP